MTEELKPLDEQKLHDFIFNFSGGNRPCGGGQDMELLSACGNLSRAICQRFGQPAVPSVKKIEKIINDELDNPSNVRMDWRYQIATAIHNNLLRGAK